MGERVIGYLEKERQLVQRLLQQPPAQRWSALREDDCSAAQILGHMAAATGSLTRVAQAWLSGESLPRSEPFAIDRYNEHHYRRHLAQPLSAIREEWQAALTRALEFAAGLGSEQWRQPAVTPRGDGETVEEVMLIASYHHRAHRLELEALLREEGSNANR